MKAGRDTLVKVFSETVRQPSLFAAIILYLFCWLVLSSLGGCDNQDELPISAGGEEPPAQEIFNYRQIESNQGIKRWVLRSEKLEKYTDREEVELFGVNMDFYRQGEYFSTLTAQRGRANLTTDNLFAWGNVIVAAEDGRRLETEELYYDNARGLIHNDVFNRFTRAGDVMTGFGMEATPEFDYFEIKRKVDAEVRDSEEEGSTE